MGREIKFRGISDHSGIFFYGDFVNHFPDTPRIVSETSSTPIKIETLGQFTGLKDKNGKDIYEGDVVRFSERRKHRDLNGLITYKSAVVYDFDCFCVSSSQENNQGLYCVNDECEVIGNIHEHKHLLS